MASSNGPTPTGGLRLPGLSAPRREPCRIPTANGRSHPVSLVTKERLRRFARRKLDRAQAQFKEQATVVGITMNRWLEATGKSRNPSWPALRPPTAGAVPAHTQDRATTLRARHALTAMEVALRVALATAECIARGTHHASDPDLANNLRRQVGTLARGLSAIGGAAGSEGAALRTHIAARLDRIERILDRHAQVTPLPSGPGARP